jgi:microcompartment protein CcmK/EutM
MQIARVIGNVVNSVKDAGLDDRTLLLIQPLTTGGQPLGKPIVACDSVGAGVGEQVFYVRGSEASFPFLPAVVPSDASIVGIIDHWTVEGTEARGLGLEAPGGAPGLKSV